MLSVSNVSMRYGAKILFDEVSVAFTPGKRYGLTGPNGSGKSTITSSGAQLFTALPILDPDAIARTIQVDPKGSSALAAGRQTLEKLRSTCRLESALPSKQHSPVTTT